MRERFRALQIIWLALMGGVLSFAAVGYILLTVVGIEMPGLPPIVLRVVAPAAVVVMAGGLFLRRKLLEAIPAGVRGEARLARYQTAVIVSLAVIEGQALLIIVLSLLSNEPNWIPTGAAAALLMMTIARPRAGEARLTD
jgi:hypothetical protein